MTAIRNEQSLQHRHAAAERDHDSAAASKINGARVALEGEIRDLVRRNVAQLRPAGNDVAASRRSELPADAAPADASTHHVNALIKQVSGASIEEIDRVIRELNGVREMLRGEGDRVTREIAGFASLSHAAITSMRVIADSVAEWKNGAQHRHDPRN
ncbi:MAG: hypothetical protein AB7O50_01230 [Pseudolabrys sp.]